MSVLDVIFWWRMLMSPSEFTVRRNILMSYFRCYRSISDSDLVSDSQIQMSEFDVVFLMPILESDLIPDSATIFGLLDIILLLMVCCLMAHSDITIWHNILISIFYTIIWWHLLMSCFAVVTGCRILISYMISFFDGILISKSYVIFWCHHLMRRLKSYFWT